MLKVLAWVNPTYLGKKVIPSADFLKAKKGYDLFLSTTKEACDSAKASCCMVESVNGPDRRCFLSASVS
jgi:hypothetical protein